MKYVLKNVNVIPMTEEKILENTDVLIENDLIVKIAENIEDASEKTIDCKGLYMIPGLVDAHIHLNDPDGQELKLFVANGVTSIRNMWGSMSLFDEKKDFNAIEIKNKVKSGEMLGPMITNTSKLLNDEPLHQKGSYVVSEPGLVVPLVNEIIDQGYEYLKIYDNLKEDVFDEVIRVAKEKGIKVVGHRPLAVSPDKYFSSNIHSLEHTIYFNDDNIQELLKCGTFLVPTLITMKHYNDLMLGITDKYVNDPLMEYADPNSKINMWMPFLPMFPEFRDDASTIFYKFDYEKEQSRVQKYIELGGEVVAGTDYANPFTYAGFSLHEELELIKDCGTSNYQALKSATITAAKCLERESEIGTVEEGKIADLVLLHKNPLENIANTKTIEKVVLHGKLIEKEEINQLLNDTATFYKKLSEEMELSEAAKERIEERKQMSQEALTGQSDEVNELMKYVGTYKFKLFKVKIAVKGGLLSAKMMGRTVQYVPANEEHKFIISDDENTCMKFILNNKGEVIEVDSTFKGKTMRFKKK